MSVKVRLCSCLGPVLSWKMKIKPEGLLEDIKATTVIWISIFTFYGINQVSDVYLQISSLICRLFDLK